MNSFANLQTSTLRESLIYLEFSGVSLVVALLDTSLHMHHLRFIFHKNEHTLCVWKEF